MAEYQKYLGLVAVNAQEEDSALKQEIEEGLEWVGLNWGDFEFATDPDEKIDLVTKHI